MGKLPAVTRLRCWNHIIRDVTRWLRAHGAPSEDVLEYTIDLRSLFHQQSCEEYQALLDEMANKWSAPFHEYCHNNLHPEMSSIGRWVLEEYRVYNPYSGVTSNQSEGLNYVIKQLQEWKESPLDCMILALYYLQSYYALKITRGQHGLGNYHLHSDFQGIFDEQPIPQIIVYPPEDFVKRIKGELMERSNAGQDEEPQRENKTCNPHLSQESRAKKVVDEGKVVHNPQLKVFTVIGTNQPHAVTLFPKETCTCPSTTSCYHILAAKMSIGMNVQTIPSRWILRELRRKARLGKKKKSGRKRPRPGDYDVVPAPDDLGNAPTVPPEEKLCHGNEKKSRKRPRPGDVASAPDTSENEPTIPPKEEIGGGKFL